MKRLLLLSCCVIFSFSSFAQSNKEDIDIIQAMYGKDKKSLVGSFIMLPDEAKKTAFWSLYDSYETERKALGRKRVALLENYAKVYDGTDDKAIDDVMLQTMELQKKVDGIIGTYYGKIKKSVGIKQAAQFTQIESYLLSATRIYILGNIPFIQEMEKLPPPAPAAN